MDGDNLIVDLHDVCFSYPHTKRMVLDHLTFHLRRGEKIGLIGHNGSGKTTLLHMIMGLIHPSSGSIRIFGEPARTEDDFLSIRRRIGFLFQNADDQLFSPTVLEDVAFGPLNLGKTPAQALDISLKTLKKLNLKGFEDRVTHRLSGGEKKLVSLATVLVMEPEVLLLDEPTTGLDESTRERIITILNDLDISHIIVSHEYDFLTETTRNIYGMEEGRIVHNGDSSAMHSHYHRHSMGAHPHEHHS